jgi:hypothetical protein
MRDKVAPRSSEDRMIVARFDMPEKLLQTRKNLMIRIEDVDGPASEVVEKQQ